MVSLSLKRKSEKIYNGNIAVREGSSDLEIEYDVDAEKSNTKDIAVYINTKFKMVAIWDLKGRRYRIKDNQKQFLQNMITNVQYADAPNRKSYKWHIL